MPSAPIGVSIVPLVPQVLMPRASSAHTRATVPSGQGVQEQCLPFTAPRAFGFLVPSPGPFVWCDPGDVPPGGLAFRSPLNRARADGRLPDERMFYVVDDPNCRFRGNAFALQNGPANSESLREPGLSFF